MTSLPNDARSNWRGVVERSLAGGEPGAAVLCLLERLRAHPSDCSAAFVESCFPPALSLFCEQLSEGAQADRAEWLWRTAIELTSPRPLSALLRSLYARSVIVYATEMSIKGLYRITDIYLLGLDMLTRWSISNYARRQTRGCARWFTRALKT